MRVEVSERKRQREKMEDKKKEKEKKQWSECEPVGALKGQEEVHSLTSNRV